jgi:hypothetical protein
VFVGAQCAEDGGEARSAAVAHVTRRAANELPQCDLRREDDPVILLREGLSNEALFRIATDYRKTRYTLDTSPTPASPPQ